MGSLTERRSLTPKDIEAANVVKDFLKGLSGERRVGDWLVADVSNSTKILKFQYFSKDILGDRSRDRLGANPNSEAVASFSFDITNADGEGLLGFNNVHKRAIRGFGTEALIGLESILGIVAKDLTRDIRLQFRIFKNLETKKWLEKNEFILENPEENDFLHRYYKIIKGQEI